jgi:hypothetical protein
MQEIKTTLTAQVRETMQNLIVSRGEIEAPPGHAGTIVATVKRLADFEFSHDNFEFYTRTRKRDSVLVIGIRFV